MVLPLHTPSVSSLGAALGDKIREKGLKVDELVRAAIIAKLAEALDVDPKYIRINTETGASTARVRARRLEAGLKLKIAIMTDDGTKLSAELAELTSSQAFWQGVNDRVVQQDPTAVPLTTDGLQASAPTSGCNKDEAFVLDATTGVCVAQPLTCPSYGSASPQA